MSKACFQGLEESIPGCELVVTVHPLSNNWEILKIQPIASVPSNLGMSSFMRGGKAESGCGLSGGGGGSGGDEEEACDVKAA
ncbi:hypothetical protein L195_g060164, partial [Trifolium pratense]